LADSAAARSASSPLPSLVASVEQAGGHLAQVLQHVFGAGLDLHRRDAVQRALELVLDR
jgi:hypothetical protein